MMDEKSTEINILCGGCRAGKDFSPLFSLFAAVLVWLGIVALSAPRAYAPAIVFSTETKQTETDFLLIDTPNSFQR